MSVERAPTNRTPEVELRTQDATSVEVQGRSCRTLEDLNLLHPDELNSLCHMTVDGECVPAESIRENKPCVNEAERPTLLLNILLAEALGTAMIVLVGCGCVCSTLSGAYSGIWQVAVVWGIGVALAIYTTADLSGAHLNPAITLAFLLVRPKAHDMTRVRALQYMAAQLLGAIVAGALNLGLYSGTIQAFERQKSIKRGSPASILSASAFGEYFPNPGLNSEYLDGDGVYNNDDVTVFHAFLTEAWGTCVLAFVIFALTHAKNKALAVGKARTGVPLMIGATVSVLLALYAPITQAGWNPARDFGPRLVAATIGGWGAVAIPGPKFGFWIYIAGPFVGAPVGAYIAEKILWA